jgi:hypothetical protein
MWREWGEKPEGKKLLSSPRRRWIGNIKMNLLEVGLGGENWICVVNDKYRWSALVNAVTNLRVS